jgi:hypothetical protein
MDHKQENLRNSSLKILHFGKSVFEVVALTTGKRD